ncbi:MAG: flagellar hook-associated protein FlgK [Phycisphaerales bacterium]|nr:flagellar hook-associated protein FlgK [Phycisphaerales bacterium]
MSITSAMNIARSALFTSQIGLNVTAQNMANVATPGYARQIAMLQAIRGSASDPYSIGNGVAVADVRRQIDNALQKRLWNGISDEFASGQKLNAMTQLEAILNEGTEFDMSSQLSGFFNTWSEATTQLDSQSTLLNQGRSLASFIQNLRTDLLSQRSQIEEQIDAQTNQANALFSELASINEIISTQENGNSEASSLRDRRDQIVTELSSIVDVTVNETNTGQYNVFVGSTPVVLGNTSRGVEVLRDTSGEIATVKIVLSDNQSPLDVRSGALGGLLESRDGVIDTTLEKLDTLASQLIFEINKLHSTGINEDWLNNEIGTLQINSSDQLLALNDPNNATFGDLPFSVENGGFFIEVRNEQTNTSDRIRIDIDLDGLDNTGAPGFGDDTSAEDIRAAINAVGGISASFDASGRLQISSDDPSISFAFSDDSSGALAVLGVNTFFSGKDSSDIDVRDDVEVKVGRFVDGQSVANGNAKTISDLANQGINGFNGRTFSSFWGNHTQSVAVEIATARSGAAASRAVRQSLESQRAGISGVSVDEESLNLLSTSASTRGLHGLSPRPKKCSTH